MEQAGFYCSTSGTVFADKDALTDHYKSDFHRYNLKRKVAGLPPVTREWFDARKEQLASLQAQAAVPKVYVCPLTKKKFQSEATYLTHTETKKFKEAMKKAGLDAPPAPLVRAVKRNTKEEGQGPHDMQQVMAAFKGGPQGKDSTATDGMDVDGDEDSGWETGDEEDEDSPAPQAEAGDGGPDAAPMDTSDWEPWDLRVSLFDNHESASFQENLEYMFRTFGFFFPDAPYLRDPEGLLRYLGAKLRYGGVPLFTAGEDTGVKRFRSLHAVQRHMVDVNKCRMLYDGNEDEYEEFYAYPDDDTAGEIMFIDDEEAAAAVGRELVIGVPGSNQVRILGSRGFKQLYRQRHKPQDTRPGVVVNQMLQSYRNFGIKEVSKEEVASRVGRLKHERKRHFHDLKCGLKNDKIFNLPKNVPY